MTRAIVITVVVVIAIMVITSATGYVLWSTGGDTNVPQLVPKDR